MALAHGVPRVIEMRRAAIASLAAAQIRCHVLAFFSPRPMRGTQFVNYVAEVSSETHVHRLSDEKSFTAATNARDLVVIKFYAPWCRACRGLEPKYKRIAMEYGNKKATFYEISHKAITGWDEGTALLQALDVNVLPLVQIYADGKRVEAFPCGPRKIELLREKLEKWHFKGTLTSNSYQTDTRSQRQRDAQRVSLEQMHHTFSASPRIEIANTRMMAAGNVMARVPLLAELNEAQLGAVLAESRIVAYDAGDILISEGDIGRRFFVLLDGECDVFELSNLASSSRMPGFSPDPTRTNLGGRTNTLVAGAYFGERALVTNEPRAASIVAVMSVVALIVDCSALAKADRKVWGEDVIFESLADLFAGSSEEAFWGYERKAPVILSGENRKKNQLSLDPAFRTGSDYFENRTTPLPVMQRLRLLRSVVRAFDQAAARTPKWGDVAEISYRQGLVAQLTSYQRQELKQIFALLDRDCDGSISVPDLASLMIAVGRRPEALELANMINKANPEIEGNTHLRLADFLALMAQAEFSAMFLEAFKLLDPEGHGWVESERLWQMMNALIPSTTDGDKELVPEFFDGKLDELIDTFGVSDGHIDYQAFVKIMMTKHS